MEGSMKGIGNYFTNKIVYLLSLNMKVILVFDGADLPLKSQTNEKRAEGRAKNKKIA